MSPGRQGARQLAGASLRPLAAFALTPPWQTPSNRPMGTQPSGTSRLTRSRLPCGSVSSPPRSTAPRPRRCWRDRPGGHRAGGGHRLVALCAAGWLYVLVDTGFGAVGSADGHQPAGTVAVRAVALPSSAGACSRSCGAPCVARHAAAQGRDVPLPIDLVDAKGPVLKVFRSRCCGFPAHAALRQRRVHPTSFALTFDGGALHSPSPTWARPTRRWPASARRWGRFWSRQAGDLNTIRELDLFFDCLLWTAPGIAFRPDAAPGPSRRRPTRLPRSSAWRAPSSARVTALAAAALTAGPLWFAQPPERPAALRRGVVARASAALCQTLPLFGGPTPTRCAPAPPAPAARPQRDNVTASRALAREYPRGAPSPPTRRAVHGHFERVQRTYTEQAATDDRGCSSCSTCSASWRSATRRRCRSASRRRAPSSSPARTPLLQEEGMRLMHRPVAPITGQFDEEELSVPREQAITRSLPAGVRGGVPGRHPAPVDGGRLAGGCRTRTGGDLRRRVPSTPSGASTPPTYAGELASGSSSPSR